MTSDLLMNSYRNKKIQLEVKNVSKTFGNLPVLEDISVVLYKGEIVSILGQSGGGKTTLFNVIAGIMEPDSGHVYLEGEEITNETGHVSYMLQKDLLLPYRTVVDNVALPLLIQGVSKKKAREEASKHFADFGLEGTQKKYPSQLSGGMKQRAALLRTYMFSQKVSLLDEPFSALDTITKNAIHDWYMAVMEKIHLSTFFITHDIDEAIKLSDRIYILGGRPGKILDEIRIDEPKPRDESFMLSDRFLDYKKEIIELLGI